MNYNDKICNYCGEQFPPERLYLIREKPTISKYCAKCYSEVLKKGNILLPQKPITFAQYKGLSISQSTTHIAQGHAVIDNQLCSVTLEETTTVTRRIIINPNNQS